jgi:hypothetical protein
MTAPSIGGWVRKVHKAGRSYGIILPPDALECIHATLGSYIYIDPSAKDFLILHLAPVPPDVTHPELFPEHQPDTPPDAPPEPTPEGPADNTSTDYPDE